MSLQTKSKLIFPIGRIKRHLKEDYGMRVSFDAAIYLAGMLEFLTADVLELSGEVAKEDHKMHIKPRHIFSAVTMNEQLCELLGKSITFIYPREDVALD